VSSFAPSFITINAMAPIEQMKKMPLVEKSNKLTKESVEQSLEKAKAKAQANFDMAVRKLKYYQSRALVLVKDPQFRTVTISSASGAVVLGSVGGAFGTASGVVLGTAAGAVPALFTFGLSLPIGAVVGGGAGLCLGTAAGVGTGAIGGGAAGFGGYRYRVEIKNGLVTIHKKALVSHAQAKLAVCQAVDKTKSKVIVIVDGVKQRSLAAGKFTKTRAGEFAAKTQQVVASEKFKVTAATATAGAVVCGGTGAVIGTTAGAALGMIPALFTFGLSIPVCAVVGGCMGTMSGTATGAAGGGAIGYGGFTYKKEIKSGAETVVATVKEQTACAKSKVCLSAAKVTESIKFYSGTGGTA
jgi:hypothetical protein